MRKYTIAPILFLLLCLLGGCDPSELAPASLNAICTALVGPIKYNTYKPTSGRYSGPVLALDLKQRNQIGRKLGCPLYKRAPGGYFAVDTGYGRKW